MLKKAVLGALMGLCSLAHAELSQITATYTGFNDINGQFQADKKLTMVALVDDVNHNGAITVDEVRYFRFADFSIGGDVLVPGGCSGGGWGATSYCLDAFSYTASGALSFDAGSAYHDESTVSTSITSGQSYNSYYNSNGWGGYYYFRWDWTPQTQAVITVGVPVVPEPATYAMLGAGLLAVGAMARRRRG